MASTSKAQLVPPPELGNDSLGRFLKDAHHNEVATFTNMPREYQRLSRLDSLFDLVIQNLNQSPHFFAGFFLVRTRATFLAACRHALSGQIGEAYVLLRVCLENA